MAASVLRDILLRLANLENEIFVLKQKEPPPLQPQPQRDEPDNKTTLVIENLKVKIDVLSKQISTHVQSQVDMKRITEQSLLLKFDSIINKKIEQHMQTKVIDQQPNTILSDELVITDSSFSPPPPPLVSAPQVSKKHKKEKTTLNLE